MALLHLTRALPALFKHVSSDWAKLPSLSGSKIWPNHSLSLNSGGGRSRLTLVFVFAVSTLAYSYFPHGGLDQIVLTLTPNP